MVSPASPYPEIGDYGLIGDCHSAALVSRRGSIDWCCMPRFDSASVFGRLLDWGRGGYCSIAPVDDFESSRRYLEDSMVLETTFRTSRGEARLIDCLTMTEGGASHGHRQVLRVVEGVQGTLPMAVRVAPRFDYGGIRPWLRHHRPRVFSAIGGNDSLVATGDLELGIVDVHDLVGEFSARPSERTRLSLVWAPPEDISPDAGPPLSPDELDHRLAETLAWWASWSSSLQGAGAKLAGVRRSAIVLKALTNAPTGAVVAAVTTSLPEVLGGVRNWDYRYSWVRDSQFAVRSLAELGCVAEADGFRRFIERSAAGNAESLHIMYGPGGERRLTEVTISDLEGYCGSAPVRVGNGAAPQVQLDVYGELLDLSWRWHQRGQSPDDDYWRFLLSLVDTAAERWDQPDRGIWELRGEPRHFVYSKVMCWVALDRGVRLAEECLRQAPLRRWRRVRSAIRDEVEARGYDKAQGTFVQSFGSKSLDGSLLLLPSVDFVAYDDPRMVRTTDAVRSALDDKGFVRRYDNDDGLPGTEGAFIACSFWLVECLARQGREAEAREVFDRVAATANDLGLFSEELDPRHDRLLGNYPQALSHLSHILAALALGEAAGAAMPG